MAMKSEHLELVRRLRAAFDDIYSESHPPQSQETERVIKAVRAQCEEAFASLQLAHAAVPLLRRARIAGNE